MGRDQKIKAARIHNRKLFGGKTTAEELHRTIVFSGGLCGGCGSPKTVMRVRTFYPMRDLVDRKPEVAMQIAAKHDGRLPCVDFKGPGNRPVPYVRVGDAYACELCSKTLEQTVAEGERRDSRIVSHIDRGPGPDNVQVQVA